MLGSVGQEFLNIVSISQLPVAGIHSKDEKAHSDGCVCVGCVHVLGESCILLTNRDGSNIWMLYLSASSQRPN